jgi:glycosyltransferase involved in cell wall biosynthesis
MILLSIIIPVYKVDIDLFENCIDSIVQQGLQDVEIIIVSDGADKEIIDCINNYASVYSEIVVIFQNNEGVSASRNRGIQNAHGEWITFVDADDWVESSYIETIRTNICSECDAVVFSYFDNYYTGKFIEHRYGVRDCFFEKDDLQRISLGLLKNEYRLIPFYFGAVWFTVYKRDFLEENRIRFEEKLKKSEDTIFLWDFLQRASRIKYVDKPIYHYRHNEKSFTYSLHNDADIIHQDFVVELRNRLKDKDIFWDAYVDKVICTYIENMKLLYFHREKKGSYFKKKKEWNKFWENSVYKDVFEQINTSDLPLKRRIIICFSLYNLYGGLKIVFTLQGIIERQQR